MKLLPRISSTETGEEGFGILFGLFAMAIVGVIGWMMVTNGIVDMTISDNYRHKSTAFFAADSGLEQSVVDMKIDSDWFQQILDSSDWALMDPLPSSITINGHTVTPTSNGNGGWVPGFYPYGDPVTLGEGTYQREIYLPPTVTELDCGDADDDGSGSKSKDSKSKDSKSEDSKSKDSKSKDSKSKGSGNDCSPAWDNKSGDSGSKDSKSKDSKSKDSKSKDSSSKDSGSKDDDYAAAPSFGSELLANATRGMAAMLMPRHLLLAGQGGGTGKVKVCHKAGGPNNGKTLTLTVGSPALEAHKGHGDTEKACPGYVDPADDPDSGGATLTLTVRATGTAGQTETAVQVLRADLTLLINPDGTVSEVQVRDWVQER